MSSKSNKKICLIGPLPIPPSRIGGPMISFQNLLYYFKGLLDFRLEVIDTAREKHNLVCNFFYSIKIIFDFLRIRDKIDVLMLNMSPGGMMLLGVMIKLLASRKTKIIIRFFGSSLDGYMTKKSNHRLSYLFKGDLVLIQTLAHVDKLKEMFPKANIKWFPNTRCLGQELIESPPNKESGENTIFKFIFVGHVKPSKGVVVIREALKLLENNDFGINYEVHLYGDLREGLTVEELAHPNLKYKGLMSPGETIKVMGEYDAFLFPTFYEGEGYPGVIIEAFIAGLPIISTSWKYIPEIVSADSGLLIKPKSPEELASAMAEIIVNKQLCQRLAQGSKMASNRFNSKNWNDWLVKEIYAL